MSTVVWFTIVCSAGLAGVAMLQTAERRRAHAEMVCLRLRFPRDLTEDATQHFLTGVTGLLPPWWKRWLSLPIVVLEVEATDAGIEHRLIVTERLVETMEQQLRATLPGLRCQRIADAHLNATVGAEYRLSTSERELRVNAADLSSKLLTAMQPLGSDERIIVQWMLTPHAPVRVIDTSSSSPRWWWRSAPTRSAEATNALRAKFSRPVLLAAPRIGVVTSSRARSRVLLRQMGVAWHGTRATGVHLTRRLLPESLIARRIADRHVPAVRWPGVFNVAELAGLVGWPVGVEQMPGLHLGTARRLAPSRAVGSSGTVLADSDYPGYDRSIALDVAARLRHVHVLGPTGVGKSTLLVNMVVSDLAAGRGVVLIDPKGDLVTDVLERVPDSRRGDVVVLDPADTAMPVGLNPLHAADSVHAEVVVENLVGLFKSLYRSSWGPRTDDIFRAALLTLAGAADATLCEVPLLLTDPHFRRRIVGRLNDPVGLESFWGWYEGLSDAERLNVVGPVLNKVRAFTMRPTVRTIVGQSRPALSMREVLANGRVLLVSLASGLLGDEAANLLGALVVAELWHTTKARAAEPQAIRRPVMAFLDEWQNLLHLPTPMASVLAEARGLGLGLTLAHQNLGQLPESARDAVLANARSRVVFQLPAGDARIIARDLGGRMSADDLTSLSAFEVAIQAFAGGATQPPATGTTRPMPAAITDGVAIREHSRHHYGVARAAVEATIVARQAGSASTAPLRRKPSARGTEAK